MFVIALDTQSGLRWSGRRHDDDEPEWLRGDSDQGLFDAVFDAILYGEQVAVGVDSPLTAPLPEGVAGDDTKVLEVADAVPPTPGRTRLNRLLDELGNWRPWTAVTTSGQRWLATRSILVWEAAAAPEDSVRAFFDFLRSQHRKIDVYPTVVNLAIAAALRAGVQAGRDELTRPTLTLPTG